MSFIPQESLRDKLLADELRANNFRFLDTGVVLFINVERDTVDILTDSGQNLKDVRIMTSKMAEFVGNRNSSLNITNMEVDIPVIGSRVIVAFIGGKVFNPVVLGCLQSSFTHKDVVPVKELNQYDKDLEKNKKFYLHQSHYWEKIDGEGNYEQYLPDGTQISVSDSVYDDLDVSYKNIYELKELKEPKTVRINHSSGTIVTIDSSGEVIIDTTKSSNKVHINSGKIYLNDKEEEEIHPLVLGDKLKDYINDTLKDWLLTHTHPTGVGPSGTPLNALSFSDIPDTTFSTKTFIE